MVKHGVCVQWPGNDRITACRVGVNLGVSDNYGR